MRTFLVVLTTILFLGSSSTILAQTSKGISRKDAPADEGSGPRSALVIGNAGYESAPLRNPVNDAREMANTLEGLNFQVELLEDASQKQMKRAIDRFGEKLRNGGVGLFYYSGHGIQVSGRNYLVPVNAEIVSEPDVEYESVDVGRVLAKMDAARNGMNLVILDACRNNPYARSFRNASQGLATLNAPSGTFIAYATAPGSVASDGTGRNGLYTGELVRHMNTPGLKLEEVFKRVRADVQEKSGNAQVPWDASSLTGDFFFVPPQEQLEQQVAKVALPQPSSSEAPKTIRADESAWKDIENSEDTEDFRFFLEEFPESPLAKTARFKLKRLERKQAKAGQQLQLADEAKKLEKERKRLEAEKKRLAEAVLKQKPESKQSAKPPAGTVIDQATGLMWQKRPDRTERNWVDANSYCRNLTLAGYSDWELPRKDVLEDMFEKKNLFGSFKRDDWYWSSSSGVGFAPSAWSVSFGYGSVISTHRNRIFYARCVRGGQ